MTGAGPGQRGSSDAPNSAHREDTCRSSAKRGADSWPTLPASVSGRPWRRAIVWARMQDAGRRTTITLEMVTEALKLSGRSSSPKTSARRWWTRPTGTDALRGNARDPHSRTTSRRRFISARSCPGMEVEQDDAAVHAERGAGRQAAGATSKTSAFWPVRHLAELIRTRQVTSVELTEMYLARLHRYNGTAEQRRHVPRRVRPRRGEAGRRRDRRRANTRDRCTAFRGARRTSSR